MRECLSREKRGLSLGGGDAPRASPDAIPVGEKRPGSCASREGEWEQREEHLQKDEVGGREQTMWRCGNV